MQTAAEMNLTGSSGKVYALVVATELIFAATQVSFHLLGYICFVLIFFGNSFSLETSDSSFTEFSFGVLGAGWEDFGMEI